MRCFGSGRGELNRQINQIVNGLCRLLDYQREAPARLIKSRERVFCVFHSKIMKPECVLQMQVHLDVVVAQSTKYSKISLLEMG